MRAGASAFAILRTRQEFTHWEPPVLDRKLLDLLVCPVSRGPLVPDESRQELLSLASGLAYPVRDGIPVLLEDQARTLIGEEIERWRNAKR